LYQRAYLEFCRVLIVRWSAHLSNFSSVCWEKSVAQLCLTILAQVAMK